ncbi:hypothetical protein ANMWB30_23940 [Arthrobacter sp. MWB30]|nr:hypothetical protein ANMWB30_23940 [Arthrobacter sp. MWB30]
MDNSPVVAESPAPSSTATVLDIALYILIQAERDGLDIFTAKLNFLCYQVQGWNLAWTGRPAFDEAIHATADGISIPEIDAAFAVFGDRSFTLQDAIDEGIVIVA